jgi:alpha-tubulin suppressor-like RCC1 family protein
MRRLGVLLPTLAVLAVVVAAVAYFVSTGTSSATASVGTISGPSGVTAVMTGVDVTVNWNAATLSSGGAVQGYRVVRSDSTVVCGSPTLVTGLSCTDTNPRSGTYTYTVKAIFGGFSASATSAPITVPAPTVTSTSPSSGDRGANNFNVAVNGTNFVNGATVSFGAAGVTVNSVTFNSPTKLTANIAISGSATLGARDVLVNEPNGDVATGHNVFTVNELTVTAVPPSSAHQGASLNVTINGTGFEPGAVPSFSNPGITVDAFGFVSATRLTAHITVGAGASTGPGSVTVSNPDGSSATDTGSLLWANYGAGTIGRGNLDGSAVNQSFITGQSLPFGLAVDGNFIYWANGGSNRIARANLDGSSTNQNFINTGSCGDGVALDAARIYWGGFCSNAVGRANLDGSSPNLGFVTGAAGPNGVAVDSGHIYWANDSSTTIGRANLDGSSPTQIFITGLGTPTGVAVDGNYVYWSDRGTNTIGRANLDGSSPNKNFITGASTPWGVTVDGGHIYWSNGGTGTIGRANLDGSGRNQSFITGASTPVGMAAVGAFTIYAAPTVTSTSPSSAAQGTGNLNVTINGSGFDSGATTSFSGTGITVNSTTFVSSTQLTANIKITVGASATARNVTVTNPDNSSATGSNVFTVNASVPTITAKPNDPSANAAPSFSFSGGGGTGYACQIDGGAFSSCTSPKPYSSLADGTHTFKVHATDGADTGPDATYTWTIDRSAPSITASPSNPSANASPSFSFTHTRAAYTFKCQLDGGGFTACTSPKTYSSVADGSHTFQVEGVDANGAATTVASYTWTIDRTAPSIATGGPLNWGSNNFGELGNGSTGATSVPVAPSRGAIPAGVNIVDVEPGYGHTLALGDDGKVYAWGYNVFGQLGNNSTVQSTVPVAVSAGAIPAGVRIVAISAGIYHSLAVDENGQVYAWGYNAYGQLGINSTNNSPVPVAVLPGAIPAGVKITKVWAGGYHSVAQGDNGKLYAWGYNPYGQLGNNSTANSSVPVAVAAGAIPAGVSIVRFATGYAHSIAVGDDGKVYTWGNNSNGELGNNSTANSSLPVVALAGAIPAGVSINAVAGGYEHTLAVGNNGKAYAWGYNGNGQLGNNSTVQSTVPVAVSAGAIPGGVNIVAVAGGEFASVALGDDGKVYTWGNGSSGQLGNNSFASSSVPVAASLPSGTTVTALATGAYTQHAEVLTGAGVTNPSNDNTPTFAFAHTRPSYTFRCQVDGAGFGACTSPSTYSTADGNHNFQVQGVSADGATTNTTSFSWLQDTVAPTASLALSAPVRALLTGQTLYYRGNTTGSFVIKDAVTDPASGPAAASFPAIATSGWTHASETVTTGSGTSPTTYTSSLFSWTANPSTPVGYAVTSRDAAGNTRDTTLTFVNDSAAPTGGAVSANGTSATAAGTSSTTSSTGFAIDSRSDYAEAQNASQSGLSSSTFTVQSETLSGSTCGAPGSGGPFTTPVTITGTTQPSGIVTGYCYVYLLTGTDNVGNGTAVSTTVAVSLGTPAITAKPSNPSNSAAASFSFSGGGGTGYACSIDGGTFSSCTSSQSYSGLADGSHTFKVHATDGAASGPDATYTWTIDTTAPVTTITLSPSAPNGANGWYSTAPSFTLSATDTGGTGVATRSYTIDSGATQTYSSAVTIPEGQHTVTYWSTDNAGSSETHHTTATIKVDTTTPSDNLSVNGSLNSLLVTNCGHTTISRASIDGTAIDSNYIASGGSGCPVGVWANQTHIFYDNQTNTVIRRANLDGSGSVDHVGGTTDPYQLASDGTYLYWASNNGGNSIDRANLDGSGLVRGFISVPGIPVGVAVANNKIYWTNAGGNNKIGRADLNGAGGATNIIQNFISTNVNDSNGIAVNGSRIYWTNRGANTVRFADLAGNVSATSIDTGSGSGVFGIALDSSFVYWANLSRNTVGRADLNGGGATNSLFSSGGAAGLAVVPAPASPAAVLTGNTLFYKGDTWGSITLTDAVSDNGSGPASATFPAIGTAGWTHNAETVTSGTGSGSPQSYTSSTYTWSANPSNPASSTVTSKDSAGNTSSGTSLTFVNDSTAPTGGALSVNGSAATGAGSSSTTSSTSFPIDSRTNYTDAASGLDTSTLTVQSATLTGTTCGTPGSGRPFATPTTISGTTQPSGIVANFCYLYTLRGTDRVGNTAAITTQVAIVPSVTSVSPSSGVQNATQSVTINGTGFQNGANVSFSGTGITVNSTTFVSSTQLTASVSIALTASATARSVTVTNTSPTSATLPNAYTVIPLLGDWNFASGSLSDVSLHWGAAVLQGNASVAPTTGLVVTSNGTNGGNAQAATGWAQATNYSGPTIGTKTLVSWLKLDSTTVVSGSPMGLTSNSGGVFDSIVYAERQANQWMAGSDGFGRTADFSPGLADTAGPSVTRQVAITYTGGGSQTISGCLNGTTLGSYTTGSTTFGQAGTAALFGPRHGTIGFPIGSLNAHILESRIYGGVLSCAQVAALQPITP